jgi:hypothetical protein
MNWGWLPRTLGMLAVTGGFVLLWLAFQHPICTMVGGPEVGDNCAPNINYLLPALFVALAGGAVLGFEYHRT